MIDMKKSNQKGFSLIEILIAITVFSIGILALGKMQITAIKGNSFANDLTMATTLAQDKAEELTGLPYDDPLINADGNQANGRYNISWNIANDYPINNTKTINIIVTWSIRGNPKSTSITSMKADII
ncbi:MAG: hypothetical protein BA871_04040 [Desulfuromonadales bacterium C00003096]|jgi:type IV pilus assembly protein PilV|nr:MAG: hypothetical protein BA871_04040 [Desulfuromonadales bacterium C00003096]